MVKVALFVRLEAKPGKEKEVESFLVSGLPIVNEEPATTAWFGIRLGPSTFGIFDAFPDEAGRQAHLSGKVAAALMAKAGELFSEPRPSKTLMYLRQSYLASKPNNSFKPTPLRGAA
jgi:quinol monooxygenase YgiN